MNGLIQGYMTLDAIAAVAFGWVIIQTIRSKGVECNKALSGYIFKVVAIYATLMSLCYLAMGYLGATSSTIAANATNGGEILTRYAAGEFGALGQFFTCCDYPNGMFNHNYRFNQCKCRVLPKHIWHQISS